jgi:hypothetical protein
MSDARIDRLYDLLPAVYRQRDAEHQQQLRDFLRVIAEQVNVVEDDIEQLYENWFIETCDDWVVPYIGDLLGYVPVQEAGTATTGQQRLRNRILVPRRELANFIRYQRRRGTLALLELIASDAASLSARAVEFFPQLGVAQPLNHLRPKRGRFMDLRDMEALDLLRSPFDESAHTVDLRRPTSTRTTGRYNIPSAAAFIWRLRSFSVTRAPAYHAQGGDPFYTFSQLGNDAPLFTNPQRENDPATIAGELNVPTPIRRRALEKQRGKFYGKDLSFAIWKDGKLVPAEQIVSSDLSDWTAYTPKPKQVAVDPVLGRFAFAEEDMPQSSVEVTYHYGFTGPIGAGEYDRPISQLDGAVLYRVGPGERFTTLGEAYQRFAKDKNKRGVIEITDSGVYVETLDVTLAEHQYLQIRAANGKRPIIRILDLYVSKPEALRVTLGSRARFVLDGIVVSGRPLVVRAKSPDIEAARVAIRHCTLVPGWNIHAGCPPPGKNTIPSIELTGMHGRVDISDSILGTLEIDEKKVSEPVDLRIRDSIVDALADDRVAISAERGRHAHATLHAARCTILGKTLVRAVALVENCIFTAPVSVARTQTGCVRYCHVPRGSRTPRRHHCQPDLVIAPDGYDEVKKSTEASRVRPRFDSRRFGQPTYCRLSLDCAAEITNGADDESEMGAFHDMFFPQRHANLRTRLDDYTPAGMETGIIYAD